MRGNVSLQMQASEMIWAVMIFGCLNVVVLRLLQLMAYRPWALATRAERSAEECLGTNPDLLRGKDVAKNTFDVRVLFW